MDTKQRANEMKEELIEWRRHIHQNPELGFEEVETQKFVEETLKQFGIPSKRVAKTGVIATIQGNSDGKTVALRLIWMHCQYKKTINSYHIVLKDLESHICVVMMHILRCF
ncbi:hypothetical protein [Geomicrobium sp. JCM 19055]|uniref:hypothetical protein n=1 Tax=Geomicrobium sp. JCM 19055 TaxID=1460649 RepID=UPI0022363B39|nr:hypothetical protein [Geomicrobium sp. JCM 19055]